MLSSYLLHYVVKNVVLSSRPYFSWLQMNDEYNIMKRAKFHRVLILTGASPILLPDGGKL